MRARALRRRLLLHRAGLWGGQLVRRGDVSHFAADEPEAQTWCARAHVIGDGTTSCPSVRQAIIVIDVAHAEAAHGSGRLDRPISRDLTRPHTIRVG